MGSRHFTSRHRTPASAPAEKNTSRAILCRKSKKSMPHTSTRSTSSTVSTQPPCHHREIPRWQFKHHPAQFYSRIARLDPHLSCAHTAMKTHPGSDFSGSARQHQSDPFQAPRNVATPSFAAGPTSAALWRQCHDRPMKSVVVIVACAAERIRRMRREIMVAPT
jgi:hypothetical protein